MAYTQEERAKFIELSEDLGDNIDELTALTDSELPNSSLLAFTGGNSPRWGKIPAGNVGGDYDVSKNFPTGGVGGTNRYTLSEAIAKVPSGLRAGGMTIKFVDSVSGKYVEWKLTAATWSATLSDWQGVDDKPTAGSENLVKSGGVYEGLKELKVDLEEDTNIIGSEVLTATYETVLLPNTGIIKSDYTIDTVSGYKYSDFIKIPLFATKLVYSKIWDTAHHPSFLGLSLYKTNNPDSHITIPPNTYPNGELNLSDYPDAEYFRFCGDVVRDTTGKGYVQVYALEKTTVKSIVEEYVNEQNDISDSIIVDYRGFGNFTSLRDAIDNAGDTELVHKTIIVKPGVYNMLPYEQGYTKNSNRNITIIGTDASSCIVRSASGYYMPNEKDSSCFKLQGNVTIKNLTIESYGDGKTRYDFYNTLSTKGLIKSDYTIDERDFGIPFKYSDYISIPTGATKLIYHDLWDTASSQAYLGLTLYTNDKSPITITPNTYEGELNLSDYPDAKFFRFCGSSLIKEHLYVDILKPVDAENTRSYCIHVNGSNPNDSVFKIVDCILINDHYCCVGADIHSCTLHMKNVEAVMSNVVASSQHHIGAIFGHGNTSGGGYGKVIMDNCRVKNASYANAIQFAPITSNLDVTLWYNILMTNGNQDTSVDYVGTLSQYCYGNNIDALNN